MLFAPAPVRMRSTAPAPPQPFEIRFDPACRRHDGARPDHALPRFVRHARRAKAAVDDVEAYDFGVVGDFDAERCGAAIVGIDQRLAAAEEEWDRKRTRLKS